MNLPTFFHDLQIDGAAVQVGTENRIIYTVSNSIDIGEVQKIINDPQKSNLYFLGGVSASLGKTRAGDADVPVKNYIYFDFDMRKSHPEMTDEDIKQSWGWFARLIENDELLGDWRYVIFTGNGLHVYYFFDPIAIKDKEAWKSGVTTLIERMETMTGEKIDHACCNVARLARLPGSFNCKAAPKSVEFVAFVDRKANIGPFIEEEGKNRRIKEELERIEKQRQAEAAHPDDDTFKTIQKLSIDKIVTKLFGWTFDGKHFFAPGSDRRSGCFVPKGENFLVHGGTGHIPATQAGFRPFDLVRAVKNIDNKATFHWFTTNFPEIAVAKKKFDSERELKDASKNIQRGDMHDIFSELQNVNFEQLKIGGGFDTHKFLIRGAVTRIGAYSNIGKSKLAYFFTYSLLKAGYRGLIFSTEVPRSIVLANLLTITSGAHFWDIVERRYKPTDMDRETYKALEIYDVSQTENSLASYEAILARARNEHRDVHFIVIDFCQAVVPKQKATGEYEAMSRYALEVQALAQKYNVAVIDLSQISNEGVRDEFKSVGMIPYKGSGHLYSSADIGVILKRDNKFDENNNIMHFDIRKHKYLPPKALELTCDFKNGMFKVFGAEFDEGAPTIAQALRLNEGPGMY